MSSVSGVSIPPVIPQPAKPSPTASPAVPASGEPLKDSVQVSTDGPSGEAPDVAPATPLAAELAVSEPLSVHAQIAQVLLGDSSQEAVNYLDRKLAEHADHKLTQRQLLDAINTYREEQGLEPIHKRAFVMMFGSQRRQNDVVSWEHLEMGLITLDQAAQDYRSLVEQRLPDDKRIPDQVKQYILTSNDFHYHVINSNTLETMGTVMGEDLLAENLESNENARALVWTAYERSFPEQAAAIRPQASQWGFVPPPSGAVLSAAIGNLSDAEKNLLFEQLAYHVVAKNLHEARVQRTNNMYIGDKNDKTSREAYRQKRSLKIASRASQSQPVSADQEVSPKQEMAQRYARTLLAYEMGVTPSINHGQARHALSAQEALEKVGADLDGDTAYLFQDKAEALRHYQSFVDGLTEEQVAALDEKFQSGEFSYGAFRHQVVTALTEGKSLDFVFDLPTEDPPLQDEFASTAGT